MANEVKKASGNVVLFHYLSACMHLRVRLSISIIPITTTTPRGGSYILIRVRVLAGIAYLRDFDNYRYLRMRNVKEHPTHSIVVSTRTA